MTKYRAKPMIVDGIRFASKREAHRYMALKLLVRAGEISGLELQPKFDLVVNRRKVGTYIADFAYTLPSGKRRYEDAKGFATPVYKLKKKIVEAMYGVTIEEV